MNESEERRARQLKLWPVVTLPISALAVWAVNAGGEALRWLGLGAIAWSLALPLLVSLEAGLFAMMLFEPLRGFLRRAQYLFLPYSATDPIHVVTPLDHHDGVRDAVATSQAAAYFERHRWPA